MSAGLRRQAFVHRSPSSGLQAGIQSFWMPEQVRHDRGGFLDTGSLLHTRLPRTGKSGMTEGIKTLPRPVLRFAEGA